MRKCHNSDYGGHQAGERTAHKVLQSGFYWPTLFKDAKKFVSSCDECQRVGNISRRNWKAGPNPGPGCGRSMPVILTSGGPPSLVASDFNRPGHWNP